MNQDSTPQWLFPDTPVSSLLAIRPLSMAVLEKYGIHPSKLPASHIGDICKAKGLAWEGFLAEIGALETPGGNSDWSRLPLYHLLDFLTQEHREFVREFLPAIKNAFNAVQCGPECLENLQSLIGQWTAFAASLIEHISVEESFLFPKILRYEYCLKHSKEDPDFAEGSVRTFAALDLLKNEKKQMRILRDFLEAAAFSALPFGEKEAGVNLFRLLETFQKRLIEHSRIEREVLFALASDLERRLYDRFISGYGGSKTAPPSFCLN
jgi:iron-sulfur cluster repair protein YtfE (RIC family)